MSPPAANGPIERGQDLIDPDPIAGEIFRIAIVSLANEMASAISRTAYSSALAEIQCFSAAICDGRGRVVAHAASSAPYLVSIQTGLRACLHRFGDDIADGDVLILNDPYDGGINLPNIFLFRPAFAPAERDAPDPDDDAPRARRPIAWAATVCRHADVGGGAPGLGAADPVDIYAEGLRLPPLKLYAAGRPDEGLHRLIERNVRFPARLFGDLGAQIAACDIAVRGVAEVVERHGSRRLRAMMNATMRRGEMLTRYRLGELADGEASFIDRIDDGQGDGGKSIPLVCAVRKRGETIAFDWTGSSPQAHGAVSSSWRGAAEASFAALKSILSIDVPDNDGVFRVIKVIAPPGTIVNALPPAACGGRGLIASRAIGCALGALAQLYPDCVPASASGPTVIAIMGADRNPHFYLDFLMGAEGGLPYRDGADGTGGVSVEIIESENPLEMIDAGLAPDSGGAGQFRGGLATRRTWRMLDDEGALEIRGDRNTHRPYGLSGGDPGAPSRNLLNPGARRRELAAKLTATLRRGDAFRHDSSGGGGWGDPLERDPSWIAADLAEEKLTPGAAERDYGVVVRLFGAVGGPVIDDLATHYSRHLMRAARSSA